MKTLTFYNAKGGVGKTTSALALASILARTNTVCVIDLDLTQNSISGVLLSPTVENQHSIMNVLLQGLPIEEAVIPSKFENISIIPCYMGQVDESTLSKNSFPKLEETLKEAIKELEGFDYLLIDCPPAMNSLTRNAIVASDGVVVPFKNDASAYKGIATMLKESSKIKELYNPNLLFLGVFLTQDKNTTINREIKEKLRASLGNRFLETTVRDSVVVPESSYASEPVPIYQPKSKVTADYEALTQEILANL